MIKVRALKSFIGEAGEGTPGDNRVRRGEEFHVAAESRAKALRQRGLVDFVGGKAAPKPDNKMAPAPENKDGGPLVTAADRKAAKKAAKDAAKAEKDAVKAATEAPEAPNGDQTGTDASASSSEPGLPLEPNANGSGDTAAGTAEISGS